MRKLILSILFLLPLTIAPSAHAAHSINHAGFIQVKINGVAVTVACSGTSPKTCEIPDITSGPVLLSGLSSGTKAKFVVTDPSSPDSLELKNAKFTAPAGGTFPKTITLNISATFAVPDANTGNSQPDYSSQYVGFGSKGIFYCTTLVTSTLLTTPCRTTFPIAINNKITTTGTLRLFQNNSTCISSPLNSGCFDDEPIGGAFDVGVSAIHTVTNSNSFNKRINEGDTTQNATIQTAVKCPRDAGKTFPAFNSCQLVQNFTINHTINFAVASRLEVPAGTVAAGATVPGLLVATLAAEDVEIVIPQPFNPGDNGNMFVIFLGSAVFNTNTVDCESIRFGRNGDEQPVNNPPSGCQYGYNQNDDGFPDLRVLVPAHDINVSCADVPATTLQATAVADLLVEVNELTQKNNKPPVIESSTVLVENVLVKASTTAQLTPCH